MLKQEEKSKESAADDRRWLGIAFTLQAFLTTYPTKAVIPGILAVMVLNNVAATAWLVGAYGAGGLLGALYYRTRGNKHTLTTLIVAACASLVLFAFSWHYAWLSTLVATTMIFSATNSSARLGLLSQVQSRTGSPNAIAGLRFTSNLSSMTLKFALGACFKVASAGLAMASGLLVAFAAGQIVSVIFLNRFSRNQYLTSESVRIEPRRVI